MATPHIQAEKGQIAEAILLPGDPLRAKFIAENFLDEPVQYNAVRNMLGYTGRYKGVPVSVQGTGMGMPSIGIYSWELMSVFGCQKLIRVGTAGSISKDLSIGNLVFGMSASTDSNYQHTFNLDGHFAPCCDFGLLRAAVDEAEKMGAKYKVGGVLSEDVFYQQVPDYHDRWAEMGILCCEMESAALYMNAAKLGRKALGIFTVSDDLVRNIHASAEERQTTFTNMMKVALEAIVK